MTKPDDYRELMKEALIQLDSLRSELDELRRAKSEPIAVIGMGCRFPGHANDPDSFWSMLRNGVDAVEEIPRERWDLEAYYDPDFDAPGKVYSRHAALVDQQVIEEFNPEFFHIAPREAERMDPQQRALLEVCWEALEDAALPPAEFRGSRTGLFVGSCTDDYLQLFNNLADPRQIDGYSSLGTARCITVGRVAYTLGLVGPVVQLDTACSSSLVAVHQACSSLRTGESDMVLAGGVNLQLSPIWTVGLCKLKALSPDGRCKTFDAAANGFVRGEGCGIIVLKRLSDALTHGDRILALIRSSAVNHDGSSSGLTVPNPAAQEDLLRQALDAAKLKSHQIDYIEAHGTGTTLGDPIEMTALGAVYRDRDRPLWIGSVKTNIGHLEGAAGIAGLIKAILALQHEELPPHLHFREPNPHIPWQDLPVRIPTQRTPWPRSDRDRFAGISSFGFSGTNAHVILQEGPLVNEPATPLPTAHLLPISAMDPDALHARIQQYLTLLNRQHGASIRDICFTAAVGRFHFVHRVAVVGSSHMVIRDRLAAFARGEQCDGVWSGTSDKLLSGTVVVEPWQQPPAPGQWESQLTRLARQYVAGDSLDWNQIYADLGARRVSLPTYPFQRRRYFLEHPATSAAATSATVSASGAEPPVHPLLGRRVHAAAAEEIIRFEVVLSPEQPAYLADHRVGNTPLLPATAQLEMALAAGRIALDDHSVAIEHAAFQRALVLPRGATRIVQTVLTPCATGYRFELFSRPMPLGTQQQTPQWTRHASGNVVPTSSDTSGEPPSLDSARRQCPESLTPDEINNRITKQGLQYGPSFRLLSQVHRGTSEALGEAVLPENLNSEAPQYGIHPTLLDACLQIVAALIQTETDAMVLPTRLDRMQLFLKPTARLWSFARLRNPVDASQERFTIDVDLLDADHRHVARLEGLRLQRVDRRAIASAANDSGTDCFYQVQWLVAPLENKPIIHGPGSWLVFADNQGVGQRLADRLSQLGHTCVLARPGDRYQMIESQVGSNLAFYIRPEIAEDYARLLHDSGTAVSGQGGTSGVLCGVVYLWSLDAAGDDDDAFAAAHRFSCGSALNLVQALWKHQHKPELWMVTSAAQVLDDDQATRLTLTQAPLAGFRRVCSVENSDFRCVQVDLDPRLESSAQADALLDELGRSAGSEQVVHRRGKRYVARLTTCQVPGGKATGSTADHQSSLAAGSYLITGGLGDLGLQVARSLADRGARHLVLAGRHGPRHAEQQEMLDQLRASGVEVSLQQADISDREQVEQLLARIHATLPPLRGIVHAAGVLDDAAIPHQDWLQFDRVMGPKVGGAWHLHCLAENLDFFIMFSSAAGLLGSPGQANYAAANAFLDALAVYRHSLGLPASSIAWGPWEIGMSARAGDPAHARMSRMGLQPIRTVEGLEMFQKLGARFTNVAVLKVDWKRMASTGTPSPLWADLAPPSAHAGKQPGSWAGKLHDTPTGNRMKMLADLIRAEVAAVLGWDAPKRVGIQQKLFDLGMDSITSVELQQRLERNLEFSLPLTLAFDYPSVQALAQYALTRLKLDKVAEKSCVSETSDTAQDIVRLAAMTDEDIGMLLRKEYGLGNIEYPTSNDEG